MGTRRQCAPEVNRAPALPGTPCRMPSGYRLDEITDPGVVILRRPDGSSAAVFSAWGARRKEIEQEAWRDYLSEE